MVGIGSHSSPNNGATNDWITPRSIIDALGGSQSFDLDPCACNPQPWPTARKMLTIDDDGLKTEWPKDSTVWLNPPYGIETKRWISKMAGHGNGIVLIFARTETKMFFDYVWPFYSSILFIEGRLSFHRPDGSLGRTNSGGPSVLIAYGQEAASKLKAARKLGALIERQTRKDF